MGKRTNKVVENRTDYSVIYATLLEHNTTLFEQAKFLEKLNTGINNLITSINRANNDLAARIEKSDQRLAELERIIIDSRIDKVDTKSDFDT